MNKLSPSEALYGFVGWLTSRDEVIKIGATEEVPPLPQLVEEFCKVNKLKEPREDWADNLIHPSGECSKIKQ